MGKMYLLRSPEKAIPKKTCIGAAFEVSCGPGKSCYFEGGVTYWPSLEPKRCRFWVKKV